jgi:hypothetical protein
MIGNRLAVDDFFHFTLAVAGMMGKTAFGFPDLLHNTGRPYGFVGHVEEPVFDRGTETVFDRGTAGVYHQYLHVIFFLRIKVRVSIWVSGFRCQEK